MIQLYHILAVSVPEGSLGRKPGENCMVLDKGEKKYASF